MRTDRVSGTHEAVKLTKVYAHVISGGVRESEGQRGSHGQTSPVRCRFEVGRYAMPQTGKNTKRKPVDLSLSEGDRPLIMEAPPLQVIISILLDLVLYGWGDLSPSKEQK